MNIFKFNRHGLSPHIKKTAKTGFVALALDGTDVIAAIAEENNQKILERAVKIAKEHDEKIWSRRCARRLHEVDPSSSSKLLFASILAAEGYLTEAEELLAQVDPKHKELQKYRETKAVLLAKHGQIDEAFCLFETLPDGQGEYHPASVVLPTATEMLNHGDFHHAVALIERLHTRYPSHLVVRSLRVKCHIFDGNIEQALELTGISHDLSANVSRYDKRMMTEAHVAILYHRGWVIELFEFLKTAISMDRTHWSLYSLAAETAKTGGYEEEFEALVKDIPVANVNSPQAMAVQCGWHAYKHRVDEAERLLKKLRDVSPRLFLSARFSFCINHGSPEEVENAYNACIACGVEKMGPTVGFGLYLYYYSSSAENINRSLRLLEACKQKAANNDIYWQLYLRLLIATGMNDDAAISYANLPKGLQNSSRLRPFAQYFKTIKEQHDLAKQGWIEDIQESRHLCVNARSSYPKTVHLRYRETPGAILLFACVFNGIAYIDWFLKHYRELGVDHFFIVDNGSTDGTMERLSRESDVSVFFNSESFAGSGFGVLWINHLLQRFGTDHWCFNVDIDEGFVFPGQDQGRSLKDLLAYFDESGFSAVRSFELDMYPESLDVGFSSDPFVESCYFDDDYFSMPSELPPYVFVQGGMRQRMTGLVLAMQKSPLVRMQAGASYIECSHNTTHLPVADISTALLHYKFIGDVKNKIDEAITKDEHFAGAKSYRRMKEAANKIGWSGSLLSPHSHCYDGPGDLVKLGLMQSSHSWESFEPGE